MVIPEFFECRVPAQKTKDWYASVHSTHYEGILIGTQEPDATPGQPSHRYRIRPGIFNNTRGQFRRRYDEIFDRRLDEEDAIVRSCGEHQLWVQNISGGIISGRSFCQEGEKPSAHIEGI